MGRRLFVGNLSYETTEDSLRGHFAADGRTVVSVRIMMDRETGRPRGFGFVDMATDAEAAAAVQELDGSTLEGRTLRVSEANDRPRPERGDRDAPARPPREGGLGARSRPPRTDDSRPAPPPSGGGGWGDSEGRDERRKGKERGRDRQRRGGGEDDDWGGRRGGRRGRRPDGDDDFDEEW